MIKSKKKAFALAGAAALLIEAAPLSPAEDWPRWGGNDPGRNMYSPAKGLPSQFDPGKFKKGTEEIDLATTKNVKWVAKLGSQSYGNPVIARGKVYIGTNNATPRDPRFTDDRSILLCLDESNGELLWQLVVPKLASGKVNDAEYIGICSSPTVDGDKVYVVTSRCEVLCLNAQGQANGNHGFTDEGQYMAGPGKPRVQVTKRDADILWKYDMMEELGVFPHNASCCAVTLLGDKLFTCTSNGMDWTHVNVPSPLAPSLIALDKNTGRFLAEDDARIGPRIKHGQWSSPSIGEINGKHQVYFGGGDGVLYAFTPDAVVENDSAFLRTIWQFDCVPDEYKTRKDGKPLSYPCPDGPSEINATPVFYHGRVYIAIGQDPEHGDGVGHLVCVDASKTGDVTKTGLVWEYKGIHRSLSTVSIDPTTGLVFAADFAGFIHCLDAETGALYWVHDMQSHVWGSTFVADGKLYCGNENGDFAILAAAKQKSILSSAEMGAGVLSTPVVANGTLFVATQTHLYAIAEDARPVKHKSASIPPLRSRVLGYAAKSHAISEQEYDHD